MNRWRYILRSALFYRRTNLGVVLAAAVATAVLTGALAVGDSVRGSLRAHSLARVGRVQLAVAPAEALFRADLARQISEQLAAPAAAVLDLQAAASLPDNSARANGVHVLGVDENFWKLSSAAEGATPAEGEVILNEALARRLHVRAGDILNLRVEKPSVLPRDAPLSSDASEDSSFGAGMRVAAVVDDAHFGSFALAANQLPPLNAFVRLDWLQRRAGQEGRANLLLVGGDSRGGPSVEQAAKALRGQWRLADGNFEVRAVDSVGMLELRSSRVFLPEPAVRAAKDARPGAIGVLTYFVNELRSGDKAVPYSMVSGIGQLDGADTGAGEFAPLPADIKDDQIVVNDWLARELAPPEVTAGQAVGMTYYILGPMRELKIASDELKLRSVVPMRGLAADRSLMPDFPGIADVVDCRNWHAGVPVETQKLRPEDIDYWNSYRGTPKGFVTLASARKMWGNRYGDLTAVRWRGGAEDAPAIERQMEKLLNPAELGFVWIPVGRQALESGATTDFASLFLGLSIFLVIAAMLLSGLLFALAMQQRTTEVGTLLAIGFTPRTVRRLLIMEAIGLSAAGSVIGVACGAAYTKLMLLGLRSLWPQAVGSSVIDFHMTWTTLVIGLLAGMLAAFVSMSLVLRRQGRLPARVLLAGELSAGDHSPAKAGAARRGRGASRFLLPAGATACCAGAAALVLTSGGRNDPAAPGAFFGAGALLLAGMLLLIYRTLSSGRRRGSLASADALAMRNATCRPMRSLATIALLTCGTFLVTAVGANRHDPARQSLTASSGTGGFALIGNSSLPIYRDLNRADGQELFGLSGKLAGAKIVGLSVKPGARADCLNLNRVSQPQVLGVEPGLLADRAAFTFIKAAPGADLSQGWRLLEGKSNDDAIPAIADANTVTWALHKKLGDTLDYVDDSGRAIRLRLIASIGNSILQGSLIISQENFLRHFPSQAGAKMLLVECPPQQEAMLSSLLTRQLSPVGVEFTPAAWRLAELESVENSYLSMFQVLGGLGLVLGSAGLALVVMRNVMERRGELALMRALGFTRTKIRGIVLVEHVALLAAGLGCGIVCAILAVLPAIWSPGAPVPILSLSATLLAVAISGIIWTFVAAACSLRGDMLKALRNE